MSFQDLPPGWAERPISDPDIFADVVDLCASMESRFGGCLYLLLCGPDGRMHQPIAIDRWDFDAPSPTQRAALTPLLEGVAQARVAPRLVAIVARRGRPEPGGNDLQFAGVLREQVAAAGLRLDGLAIATPLGVWLFRRESLSGAA